MIVEHSPLLNEFVSFWIETRVDGVHRYDTFISFLSHEWHLCQSGGGTTLAQGTFAPNLSEDEIITFVTAQVDDALATLVTPHPDRDAHPSDQADRWEEGDNSLPHDQSDVVTDVIVGAFGFLVAGITGFYAATFAWGHFNTVPPDEMSQGIAGSLFSLAVAVPVGIVTGIGGSVFVLRITRESPDQ